MHQALWWISVASISVGLLWSVDAVTHVESFDETSRVDAWAERAGFSYAPLRADGSELPMGEPGYFTSDAPRLRVAFTWTLDDDAMERVTALGSLRLVVAHPASPGRPAWTHEAWLANATFAGGKGEALALQGEIDLPATKAAIEATPGRDVEAASWSVVARVKFASAPNAARSAEASDFTLPITHTPPLYVLPGENALAMDKDHARSETIHHETRAGIRALVDKPAGIALLFGGLAALAYAAPRAPRVRDEEATS